MDTPLYRMVFSNRGAVLRSAKLKEYLDSDGNSYEMVAARAGEHLNVRPLEVRLSDAAGTEAIANALFERVGPSELELTGEEDGSVTFVWSDGRGLAVEKTLGFDARTYRIAVDVTVKRQGEELAKGVVYGAGIGNEITESRYVGTDKGVVVSRGEVALFAADDVADGEGGGISVEATGVASHYFAALMLPRDDGIYGSRLEQGTVPTDDEKRPQREVISAVLEAPQSAAAFTLYLGPKKLERLEALAPGLGQIIEFGSWMRYPALLLRGALLRIYDTVGNYGWAIVLLTVLINIVLVPLKHYSFVSMKRMQKIAPQMQKIRERYKKVKPTDPRYQEMNKEIMALQKEHGVNPVSGCLPMLLMIPFFFAFYRLLMASIELRQAPFLGWITDLSLHDPLFVLPVLMGGTQLAIQKMTPQTTADPVQAKIMGFMPILFTFILAWAPSGLVLYWFSNNLVSMAQQTITNKVMKDTEPPGASDSDKSGKKRKGKKAKKDALARAAEA